jgi:hypothetical protein
MIELPDFAGHADALWNALLDLEEGRVIGLGAYVVRSFSRWHRRFSHEAVDNELVGLC